MSAAPAYEAVIGLEVHAQLLTRSKIFCGCSTAFGSPPNTQVCPVCMGLPGALPVLNEQAVRLAVRAALALNIDIRMRSVFARKNYFYPDLPKGYQISQYDEPISEQGWIELAGDDAGAAARRIRIKRLHLEEDAGKSFHPEGGGDESLIDLNRCGVPLIEIVSEPDLRTSREAAEYVARLKEIVEFTEVSDGNMEEGSLRCDVNISVRRAGETALGVKAEIKNLNSIKAVAASIDAEIARQSRLLASGGRVVQETLLWDAKREVAVPMRSKEEAHDYRYFPEPDLHPLVLTPAFLDAERAAMPELPHARRERFVATLGVGEKDARVLTATRALADYFERAVTAYDPARGAAAGKRVATWVQGEVLRLLKEGNREIASFRVTPEALAELIAHLDRGEISNLSAKEVLAAMDVGGVGVREAIDAGGHRQISDDAALREAIRKVIADNPGPVSQVRGGKEKTFAFLVGQVMKATRGAANPKLAQEILWQEIEGRGPIRAGTIELRGAEPTKVHEDNASAEEKDLTTEQQQQVACVGRAIRAYVKAAREMLEGRLAHVADQAPPHLRAGGDIVVVSCADGVVIRYDSGAPGTERRVISGWSHQRLSDNLRTLSQTIVLCHNADEPSPPLDAAGIQVSLSSEGEGGFEFSSRIAYVLTIPERVADALPLGRPTCLASIQNTLELHIHGELRSVAQPDEQGTPFLARALLRLPVGWECIEIYTKSAPSIWASTESQGWAEREILAGALARQTRDFQLRELDPKRGARREWTRLLKDFERLLESDPEREEILQDHLKSHFQLISPSYKRVLPKQPLGPHITDFVFEDATGDYVLVEIERSTLNLFKGNGDTTSEMNHAINQVVDWRRYLEDHAGYVRSELGLSGISTNPRSMIVIGRSRSLGPEHRRKIKALESMCPKLRIMTYDDVLAEAKACIENLLGPLLEGDGSAEIYVLPSSAI